ncbi:MAG: VTT domain-containing protein [Planctomycetes bacterium]|nr:VTT domain-containing protein [Planctomycetota bacterium]
MTLNERSTMAVQWVSAAVIAGGLIAIARLLPVDRVLQALLGRIEGLGVWGPAAFAALYVLSAVLLVPGSALTIAAGALFGLALGTAMVSLASTLAAGLAFLLARYLARDAVRRKAGQSPTFGAVDAAIGARGWVILALLRLSPVIPFSLSNYLFGLTLIRFWPYLATSWLTMLPGTFLYVYLGYAGRAGLEAASGTRPAGAAGRWALLAVGLVATLAVTAYVTRLARKAVRDAGIEAGISRGCGAPGAREAVPARGSLRRAVLLASLAGLVVAANACAYLGRDVLQRALGPPRVTMVEAYEDQREGRAFDHALLDGLLRRHVDGEGRVDYRGLKDDGDMLERYIETLAVAPFDGLGRDEKLALLLNAYNAFTLRLVLERYPLRSIKDIPAARRWEDRRWRVGPHVWSLEEIEHEQIRSRFREPRVHFALVCAAKGCPPLRSEAFTGKRLEGQLEDQARRVHAPARWLELDLEHGTVRLTRLYDWYGGDFEQGAGSVLEFAARYVPELREALAAGKAPRIEWLDYEWSLNGKGSEP